MQQAMGLYLFKSLEIVSFPEALPGSQVAEDVFWAVSCSKRRCMYIGGVRGFDNILKYSPR